LPEVFPGLLPYFDINRWTSRKLKNLTHIDPSASPSVGCGKLPEKTFSFLLGFSSCFALFIRSLYSVNGEVASKGISGQKESIT
tara:strand:+ start:350 stop:601 length:252 start_codon:yes stop_codon:yes gene_type:complete